MWLNDFPLTILVGLCPCNLLRCNPCNVTQQIQLEFATSIKPSKLHLLSDWVTQKKLMLPLFLKKKKKKTVIDEKIDCFKPCQVCLRICQISMFYTRISSILRVWEFKDYDNEGGGKWCLEQPIGLKQISMAPIYDKYSTNILLP